MTLTEFLLARISEDEEIWPHASACFMVMGGGESWCSCTFDARWRVELEAKRRIIELHTAADGYWHECPGRYGTAVFSDAEPCDTLRLLALPYADHPDYQQEWAV